MFAPKRAIDAADQLKRSQLNMIVLFTRIEAIRVPMSGFCPLICCYID